MALRIEMRRSSTALMALLLLLAAAAAAARREEQTRQIFAAWMAAHGKAYSGVGEEERRYAAFKVSLREVERHNAAADAGVYSYRLGLNDFSDLTDGEFQAMCCGGHIPPRNENKVWRVPPFLKRW